MDDKLIKLASYVLSSFFLLILLLRLFDFVNIDLHISQIMSVIFLLSGICCARRIKTIEFDFLIYVYIVYMLLNGVLIDYKYHGEFLYRALLSHVFPIMCYFIGRYSNIDISLYLRKMKWPILFAMVCGIAFYYVHPSWYVVMKESQIGEYANEMSISGVYRLSSFWGHPYIIGYATLLYSFFVTFRIIQGFDKKINLYFYLVVLFICIVVLMLAQLRVTIIVYLLSLIYMLLFAKRESFSKKTKKIILVFSCFAFFAFLFVQFASDSLDYINDHMLNLTEDDSMSDRFEHTAGGVNSYSLFGDGLGRYGYPAREHGMWAIVDHEFQCHVAELGYFGVSILCCIIFFTTIKCVKRIHLVVENSILIFFFIAMLGASVLSNSHQYNYIFWYTLGLVWSNKYEKEELTTD